MSVCDVESHKRTTLVRHNRHNTRKDGCPSQVPLLSPYSPTAQQHYGLQDERLVGLFTAER